MRQESCWTMGIALLAISIVIQASSLAFWLPLEIYQMETLGHPTFVIALRMKNIIAFALGKMGAWGLNNHAMTEDPWDYVHITTWNFFALLAEANRRRASVGCKSRLRHVERRTRRIGSHALATPESAFAASRVTKRILPPLVWISSQSQWPLVTAFGWRSKSTLWMRRIAMRYGYDSTEQFPQ